MQLFDLQPEYAAFAEIEADVGAPKDEPAQLTADLESLRDELTPKLLALAKVVRTLETEADVLEQHGRSLTGKASTRRTRAEYLKRWIHLQLEGAGLERLKDPFVTIWLQKSPPVVVVLDDAAVPPEYKRVTLRMPLSAVPPNLLGLVQTCDVDRASIHDLVRATGELPPGTSYDNKRRHLRIH